MNTYNGSLIAGHIPIPIKTNTLPESRNKYALKPVDSNTAAMRKVRKHTERMERIARDRQALRLE